MTTVTTAGSNGVPEGPEGGAPQEDDPFGYLYRPAEGSPASAGQQQGAPRSSYSRPMEVGRAQYGQQPQYRPQPQPRQQGQPVPPSEYGSHAQTQQIRYAEHSRPQPGEERASSGRSKGAVIGAVAVVAAIAIGAGIALSTGGQDKDKDKNAKGVQTTAPVNPTGTAPATGTPSASPTSSATAGGLTTTDATQLQAQNAPAASTVKGAKSADGSYLTMQPGSSVTWKGDAPAAGAYKFTVHFNNASADAKATVNVNGKDRDGGIDLKNYQPGGDAAVSWYNTWILPQLQAGPNTVTVTVTSGTVLIDQITVGA
ncbi:hypothetical protein [Kitasatospora sp. NPDC050543]|uniref:hypothetical protein n=1 Tax=Kitasatospora sp. NPDC050543 TaxID=3364054 RepID=UPI00378B8C3E